MNHGVVMLHALFKSKKIRASSVVFLAWFFISCGSRSQFSTSTGAATGSAKVQVAVEKVAVSVGCKDFESTLWDAAYASVSAAPEEPGNSNKGDLLQQLHDKINAMPGAPELREQLFARVQEFLQILQWDQLQSKSIAERLRSLSTIEIGAATTPEQIAIQDKLKIWRASLQKFLQQNAVSCKDLAPEKSGSANDNAQKDSQMNTPTASESKAKQMGEQMTSTTTGGAAVEGSAKNSTEGRFVDPTDITAGLEDVAESPAQANTQPAAKLKTNVQTLASKVVAGAHAAMAVAYQSCAATTKAPISAETPNLEGVAELGRSNSGGVIRKITNLAALLKSHYYLTDGENEKGCHDVRRSPLLYNFGGKPNVATSEDGVEQLDLFSHGDEGKGTSKFLGIDCSAYVFSALAAGGLKLAPDKAMKPVMVYGLDSYMFLAPEKNGLTCFERPTMGASGTLHAGDIIAEAGHIILLGDVGVDPLGIRAVSKEEDCSKITAKDFKFTVMQSSSSKNGIGINKYVGADYALEDPAVRHGLESYAHQACVARLRRSDIEVKAANIQVVRYKESAECTQRPIALNGASCVRQCLP